MMEFNMVCKFRDEEELMRYAAVFQIPNTEQVLKELFKRKQELEEAVANLEKEIGTLKEKRSKSHKESGGE